MNYTKFTPVYHRHCGGHVGYVKFTSYPKDDAENFYLLNGLHPESLTENLRIGCMRCNNVITDKNMLVVA